MTRSQTRSIGASISIDSFDDVTHRTASSSASARWIATLSGSGRTSKSAAPEGSLTLVSPRQAERELAGDRPRARR